MDLHVGNDRDGLVFYRESIGDETILDLRPSKRIRHDEASVIAEKLGYRTRPSYLSDMFRVTTLKGYIMYIESDEAPTEPANRSHFSNSFKEFNNFFAKIKSQTYVDDEPLKPVKSACHFSNECHLWVDKYAPTCFLNLITNEKANREILSWIKEWDPCVFGRKFKNPLRLFTNNKKIDDYKLKSSVYIKNDRPIKKCVLIGGPPGIGKTTLAHILMRSAGYDPIEFNASDDRTLSKFIPKVLDVIQNESISRKDGKPKALIIDEIDGIVGGEIHGVINAFVRIIDDTQSLEERHGSNFKGSVRKLMRPIICICNNIWTPALRHLREKALVFQLDPPSTNELVSKLEEICTKEGVYVSRDVLTLLCEITNGDVRCCLNTLQMLSSSHKVINIELVKSIDFGHKDLSSNIFEVWKKIFLRPNNFLARDGESKWTMHSEMEGIRKIVERTNCEKLIEGIFENFLSIRYNDPLFTKTCYILDWIIWYRDLEWSTRVHNDFVLTDYFGYVACAVHVTCKAEKANMRLSFPHREGSARALLFSNENLVQNFLAQLPPSIRPFLERTVVVMEFVPFMIHVIAPDIRCVNVNLMTSVEKERLSHIVGVHIFYGIRYELNSGATINYEEDEKLQNRGKRWTRPAEIASRHLYHLMPPINKLTHFTMVKNQAFDKSSDNQRQIISIQIEHKINCQAAFLEQKKYDSQMTVQNSLKNPGGRCITPTASATDFFRNLTEKKGEVPNIQKKIYFKYHEGKTDAIRRKVLMKEIL